MKKYNQPKIELSVVASSMSLCQVSPPVNQEEKEGIDLD
jgi:hypothetical protein